MTAGSLPDLVSPEIGGNEGLRSPRALSGGAEFCLSNSWHDIVGSNQMAAESPGLIRVLDTDFSTGCFQFQRAVFMRQTYMSLAYRA